MSRYLWLAAMAAVAGLAEPCLAQDAAATAAAAAATPAADPAAAAAVADAAAAAAAAPAPVPDKGDTAWMLVSTALVLVMTLPGLALFYGGLVRSKNVLSILMQVMAGFSLLAVLWVIYGYSVAFGPGGVYFGGLDRAFLADLTPGSIAATFSRGTYIPEITFVAFQLTFAGITPALIIGSFAERLKFSTIMIFLVLWFTFSYLPIARAVWFWAGPDAYAAAGADIDALNASAGFLWQLGAIDFAGGTVVHINAGVAGLIVALLAGRRLGYPHEAMPPHNLPMVLIGTGLLWFGWFGFNAGSNLESNGYAGLAMLNTMVAAAAATWGWALAEWIERGKPSLLGGASGCIAGLVAITPAAGFAGPMGAIALGFVTAIICFLASTHLKRMLGYDDSLDVFGIHGVGGIVGALGTAIVAAPSLGGQGYVTDWATPEAPSTGYDFGTIFAAQFQAVLAAVVITAVVSAVAFFIAKALTGGGRVAELEEREGLDLISHGERAYN